MIAASQVSNQRLASLRSGLLAAMIGSTGRNGRITQLYFGPFYFVFLRAANLKTKILARLELGQKRRYPQNMKSLLIPLFSTVLWISVSISAPCTESPSRPTQEAQNPAAMKGAMEKMGTLTRLRQDLSGFKPGDIRDRKIYALISGVHELVEDELSGLPANYSKQDVASLELVLGKGGETRFEKIGKPNAKEAAAFFNAFSDLLLAVDDGCIPCIYLNPDRASKITAPLQSAPIKDKVQALISKARTELQKRPSCEE